MFTQCIDLWHKTATHFPNCGADWSKLSSILLRDTGYVEHWWSLVAETVYEQNHTQIDPRKTHMC